jgi:hypothetical protein
MYRAVLSTQAKQAEKNFTKYGQECLKPLYNGYNLLKGFTTVFLAGSYGFHS